MQSATTLHPSGETTGSLLPWILRAGVAGCFIGHGAFGMITKAAWVPYFAVGGVSEPWAWRLMPWVGAMDITVGCLALLWPCRVLFLWATVWGLWTALLRPLSGESCWEFWERAGNYGVPLALLAVAGWRGAWFRRLFMPGTTGVAFPRRLDWILRLVTFTLLAGHAGCTLLDAHPSFARNFTKVWPHGPVGFIPAAGVLDLVLAIGVLIRPSPALLLGVCGWKLATESLFLFAGSPVWEVIERFGSYTAPLALAYLLVRSCTVGGKRAAFTNSLNHA
jgi:hypothetical protein